MPGLLKRGSYMRKYGNHWQFEKKNERKKSEKRAHSLSKSADQERTQFLKVRVKK